MLKLTKLFCTAFLLLAGFVSANAQEDEVFDLTADMFYQWNGYGADAVNTGAAVVDFKVGESLGSGAMVAGTSTVDHLIYADLTGCTKMIFEGTAGMQFRVLMNRQESNSGPLEERNPVIGDDGKGELDLTEFAYVHLNAIKTGWGSSSGTVTAIKLVKPADPLAINKEQLKSALSHAKLQSSFAKTTDSWNTLQQAIADGETALASATDATSLDNAKDAIVNAEAGLTLLEGYSELTADMLFSWTGWDADAVKGNQAGCAYDLFKSTSTPYGDGSVIAFADLSAYDKLQIVSTGGTPRFLFNRDVNEGQWNENEAESHLIDNTKGDANSWHAKYFSQEGDVYTVDLAQLVADKGFAHLHAIKTVGGNVVVSGMYLYKGENATTTKTIALVPGVWAVDGATFAAYAWNGAGNAWFPFVEVSGVYATQIPDTYTGIILVRLKPSTAEGFNSENYGLNWDNKWNQTDDIDFTTVADQTVFTITGWGEGEGAKSTYEIGAAVADVATLKTELQNAINLAAALAANSLKDAIEAAQAVVNNPDATAADVMAAAATFETQVKNYCKAALEQVIPVVEILNEESLTETLNAAKAAYANDAATAAELATALKNLADAALPFGTGLLAQAKEYLAIFNKEAATALAGYFQAVEEELAKDEKDFAALREKIMALKDAGWDALGAGIEKLEGYAADINNETLNNDLAAIKTAYEANNLSGLFTALKTFEANFGGVAAAYLAEAKAIDSEGKEGADALNAAISALEAQLGAATPNIMQIGLAVRNLVIAMKAFKEANPDTATYTIAGTKDLTGTESDWQIVEANNMALNAETGLYEWTAENITVSNDAKPEFKVVKKDAAGNETWYPEGDGTTNWVITPESLGGEGIYTITITFNPANNEIGVTGVKAESGEEDPEVTVPEGWTNAITNGNLAGEDASSYFAKEYPSTDIVPAAIVAGAGKNGSRGILVKTADETAVEGAQDWDSQFWIVLKEELPSGSKLHVEFDYKASETATANTQAHGNPGAYQHYMCVGDVNFTTEWQHFSADVEVSDAMAKGNDGNGAGTGLKSIGFNMAVNRNAVDYQFDNFGVWYQKPVEITSMAIVGDFLGLEGDANWDVANGWAMSQSAENIWTLTKKFTAEAKKYEYKAYANGETTGYQLPAEGNQDFVFGTDEYPAGEYNLSFTANTKEHKLTLDVEKYIPEGEEAEEKVAPEGWTNAITNGNLAGEDATSYFMKEYPSSDIVAAAIVEGAGKNGSRGILVKAGDDTENESYAAWDSQFWIKLKEAVPAGTKVHVEFDYKASQAAKASTQSHGEPGVYQHYIGIGDVNFTTEWQHFSTEIEVDDAMAKGDNGNGNGIGLLTIAFNLQEEKSATDYHFDNFGVWYQKPVEITSMAIVGDFLGLEGDANWDLANGWAMEQDAEDTAIWTLKKEKFTAEAKTYEYKAVANGVWGEYELPELGNQNYVFTVAGDYDLTFTADTKNHNVSLYAELITNEGEEAPELVAPKGWVSLITNGNLAGDNADSYVMKEYPSTDIVPAAIEAGAGKNGSRGIIVRAGDDTENSDYAAWDSQFWIVLSEALPSGTKLHVEFDFKASQAAKATTQAHGNPGAYQHWAAIGDVNFTEEWQHFSKDIEVDDAMAKGDNGNGSGTGLLTIAFNLQEEKSAVDYHFDNFGVWYEKPVVINSMAIVGDFLGLATEENPNANWNPANGWQMEQDAENPAIWTLTKPFTAEAKTYEYKAVANGKYGDFEVPAEGNYNFEFGTDGYPVGDYNLTFTVDTENKTLDLVVKPATILTFTATFTTNAYWWDEVYAYAWTEDDQNVTEYLGAWPGIKLKANAEGVYTVKVEGEVAPAMICFSNGNTGEGNQTEDLTFEDGKAYQYVFTPTFDFENNNGQWAEGATFVEPATMDDITLTGTDVKYTTGQLRFNKKGASITLTAPQGKSIVQMELKALKTLDITLTPSNGELTKTKELVEGEAENENVIYSIWTWTGNSPEVSFTCDKRQRNIGFINVTLGDIVAEDIAIYPTGGDIAAALEEAKAKVAKVGNITINLAVDGDYTLGATLTAPNSIFIYGNEGTVTVAEEMTGDFITLNGTEVFAMKSETEASDHYLIPSVEIRGLNLKGLQGALIKDNQKTFVENLVIDYANIEMPASNKNVLDFNGKGYAGNVTVTNSTIWANGMNTGFFAQYGSRPKNINGDWLQEFDIEKSTFVNIANGKNFCDLKQNGTAQNVYTLKNNIFVDCGKSGQTVVGFNKGQTSATPVWDVTGNYFEAAGACTNAAETEKAGQKNEENIVKDCVEGKLTFADAAAGDFNGRFVLPEGTEAPEALGAPYWTITYSTPYYLAGNMNSWLNDGVKEEYNLAKNTAAAEGIEEYMITIDLAADAQFKVVKAEGEAQAWTWYPAGNGNAYGENGELEKEGNYTIYFRPNADGGADWFNGVIYVQYNETTGINAVSTVAENAVIYDLQGRRVTKAQKGLFIVNGKKVVLK